MPPYVRAPIDLVEHRLELALFEQILAGQPAWIDRQVWVAPRRRADIVFRTASHPASWVVVEVKAGEAGWAAIEQLAGYVEALGASLTPPIVAVLAAPSFAPDLLAAARADDTFPIGLHPCAELLRRVA